MLGHDVLRAGERAGHELVRRRPARSSTSPTADRRSLLERCARAGPDAVRQLRGVDRRRRRRGQARGGARGQRRRRGQPRARGRAASSVPLLHVSTDYVFDGVAPLDEEGRPRPYVESDPTGPRSVYGATQARQASAQVLAASPRHTVVRTAWLYGVGRAGTSSRRCCALARASASRCRSSPTRSARRRGRAISRRRCSACSSASVRGLVHLDRRGRRCPGTASPARSSARPSSTARCEPASSEQMAPPGAAPGVVGARVRARGRAAAARLAATGWRGTWRRGLG